MSFRMRRFHQTLRDDAHLAAMRIFSRARRFGYVDLAYSCTASDVRHGPCPTLSAWSDPSRTFPVLPKARCVSVGLPVGAGFSTHSCCSMVSRCSWTVCRPGTTYSPRPLERWVRYCSALRHLLLLAYGCSRLV